MSNYDPIYITREEALEALPNKNVISVLSPIGYEANWGKREVEQEIETAYEIWWSRDQFHYDLHIYNGRMVYRFDIQKPDSVTKHRSTDRAINGCSCESCMNKVEGILQEGGE